MSDTNGDDAELLTAALNYAAAGLPVFPLQPRSKHPLRGSRAYKDATTDLRQVEEMWTKRPTANIGIACGDALTVLDIDTLHGYRAARKALGAANWRKLLRTTNIVRSGRPGVGFHVWMRGADVGLVPSLLGVDKLGLRGAGAYVVAPPSIHPDTGRAYAFRGTVFDELVPVPTPLLDAAHQATNGVSAPLADDLFVGATPPLGEQAQRFGWTVDEVLDALVAADCRPRRSGNGWQAFCPCHDDRHRSLGIVELADGKAWVKCHGDPPCDWQTMRKVLGLWKDDETPSLDHGHDRHGTRSRLQPVDWDELWTEDFGAEWLFEPIVLAGKLTSIHAKAGVGKSLLALLIVVQLLKRGIPVVVFDYEMDRRELRDRLQAMGCEKADLANLHYLLFPQTGPLDQPAGAAMALEAVTDVQPGFVVFDSVIRLLSGDETAERLNALYGYTLGPIAKQLNIPTLILDHHGKDESRGARGTTDKLAQVDVSWSMSKMDTSAGRTLTLDSRLEKGGKGRSQNVPEVVEILIPRDADFTEMVVKDSGVDPDVLPFLAKFAEMQLPKTATVREARAALMDRYGKAGNNGLLSMALKLWKRG